MSDWDRLRRLAKIYKDQFPAGTRIICLHMDDPYPVKDNTRGTVVVVDDAAQIHVKWDNGGSLALVSPEDKFRRLTPEEVAEEYIASHKCDAYMRCNKCGGPVLKSNVEGYTYTCPNCDEDLFGIEAHLGPAYDEEELIALLKNCTEE